MRAEILAALIFCAGVAAAQAAVADQAYAARRKLALAAGLKWGAYHFFDFSASPLAQAESGSGGNCFFGAANLQAIEEYKVMLRPPEKLDRREFLRTAMAAATNVSATRSGGSTRFLPTYTRLQRARARRLVDNGQVFPDKAVSI